MNFSLRSLIELAGWYGTIAIVAAYACVSFGLLRPDDLPYQLLNMTGAAGLLADTVAKKDYQPAVLNIVWIIVALMAVGRVVLR